jgi:hypothetical protein
MCGLTLTSTLLAAASGAMVGLGTMRFGKVISDILMDVEAFDVWDFVCILD